MGYVIPANQNDQHGGSLFDFQAVDLGNGLAALLSIPATRTRSQVAVSIVDVQLLAANANGAREVATVTNNGTADLWVNVAGGAAVVGAGTRVGPGGRLAFPAGYQGAVRGIWAAAGGSPAWVSEVTT